DFVLRWEKVVVPAGFAVADGVIVFLVILWVDGIFLRDRLFRGRLLSLLGLLRRRLLRLGRILLSRGILALRDREGRYSQAGAAECEAQGLPQDGVHKHLRLP